MLDKIKTLGQLGAIASEAKARGQKVVLAHGVFDVLHVGHKRHLDIGKRHGDVLIVTLTTDKYVNKGPDRPVFPEKLRAEMVAALESVDYVGISPNPGAEPVIGVVRPASPLARVSTATRKLMLRVARNGVLAVDTIRRRGAVYRGYHLQLVQLPIGSCSSIPRRPPPISRTAHAPLRRRPAQGGDRCRGPALPGHGDTILDEYIYVEPLGKPAKENIIATKYKSRRLLWRAIATANLSPSRARASIGDAGREQSHEDFIRDNLH